MRLFYTREFSRAVMDYDLGESALLNAAKEVNSGLWDASLGGHVYKKRLAVGGRGKRGGIRALIAFKRNDRVIFIYGFRKNQRANITLRESIALKRMATELLGYKHKQLDAALKYGELIEIEVNQIG